ncbi:MAG: dipeptidase [Colwellia sp.]|nr:dipeptidase [Colwellia sp.]
MVILVIVVLLKTINFLTSFKEQSVLKKLPALSLSLFFTFCFTQLSYAATVSSLADQTAQYAVDTYQQAMVDSLAKFVIHNTVATEGLSANDNPAHIAFKKELKQQALALGLDFQDHGYIVIVGLGQGKERVGIITHGDIQPANPSKWQKSPFELDLTSEPGKLIGRGTEDDKGPISTALYAMKAIKDKNIKLNKRIELYVYMAEESDWAPLQEYVKNNTLPQTNITIDSEYPIVTAEKGYGTLKFAFKKQKLSTIETYISHFEGGYFGSQIPEDAKAVIENADISLLQNLMHKVQKYSGISFDLELKGTTLTISALGKSAHSSKPADGVNAIPYLADLLSGTRWRNNGAGTLVNFINDNIGLGLEGKKFGDIAYRDDFMGPMTVSPTVIKQHDDNIELNINIRRPRGKTANQLRAEINSVVATWKLTNMAKLVELDHHIGDPWIQGDVPHAKTLLSVFSHFTGIKNAQAVAIGGGTNSRLFPNAVSFGPSMPNTEYTGHSEHEFITMKQFILNLKMYTAAMIELAR